MKEYEEFGLSLTNIFFLSLRNRIDMNYAMGGRGDRKNLDYGLRDRGNFKLITYLIDKQSTP